MKQMLQAAAKAAFYVGSPEAMQTEIADEITRYFLQQMLAAEPIAVLSACVDLLEANGYKVTCTDTD